MALGSFDGHSDARTKNWILRVLIRCRCEDFYFQLTKSPALVGLTVVVD